MLVDNVEMVMNTKILLTIFTIVLELVYGASEGGEIYLFQFGTKIVKGNHLGCYSTWNILQ